ncbi:hypothetical protein [Pseudarthrobacter sp. fls2-241-R2A-127]|uniref:hypothetical protein n=1 Tax=Pseudarthrobacter sp. fls2-241-R2A-127 TaxID=3040303 RepID=UPI0025548C13|nr:hypothetical protein [Pseudarthrobacter sp. fls2-241-R2A-127]
MTATLLTRLRDWALDTFTCESEAEAAGAMADASRWGWLPALSGVSVGADHAHAEHLRRVPGRS